MGITKLSLDDCYEELPSSLIAIHSNTPIFRIAFILNKYFDLGLKREKEDVEGKTEKIVYPLYKYFEEKELFQYYFVANKCKTEEIIPNSDPLNLFEETVSSESHYLIPEEKTVDYFLKIEPPISSQKINHILDELTALPIIQTCYAINSENLKSNHQLIFD